MPTLQVRTLQGLVIKGRPARRWDTLGGDGKGLTSHCSDFGLGYVIMFLWFGQICWEYGLIMFNQVVWWFWNICWDIILKFGRWFAVFLPLACWSITFMRRQDGIPVWKEWAPWGQTIWNGLRPSKHSENLRWCIMDYLHCCLCLLCLCGIGMSHTNSPPILGNLATKVFSVIGSKDLESSKILGHVGS